MLITAHSLKSQKWGYKATDREHTGSINSSVLNHVSDIELLGVENKAENPNE
jgi:hypothetical protein